MYLAGAGVAFFGIIRADQRHLKLIPPDGHGFAKGKADPLPFQVSRNPEAVLRMAQHDPSDDRLYGDAELAQFYDLDNGWGADLEYCRHMASTARSVLDLGCGTGRFAATLAEERLSRNDIDITAVDPAAAMLDIARHRPGGGHVRWIEDDARSLRLGRQFDLVLLTGHAFQVFLTDEDQLAVLQTIATHLTPGGRFIFDSRNPVVAEWRGWLPEQTERQLQHPQLGTIKAWNDRSHDAATGIVTYETYYQCLSDHEVFFASSRIAFPSQDHLARMMELAGLTVETWLGNWQGDAYGATSPDIIPIGRQNRL